MNCGRGQGYYTAWINPLLAQRGGREELMQVVTKWEGGGVKLK